MAKDTYWFRHDAGARNDLKMLQLKKDFGFWGKGIYWDIVEVLREHNNYKYPSDDASIKFMCEELIRGIELPKFIELIDYLTKVNKLLINDGGFIFSKSLINRMKKWESTKNNGSQGGRGNKKANSKANKNLSIKPIESIIEDNRRINKSLLERNISELKSSSQMIESACMRNKITPEICKECLEIFITEQKGNDGIYREVGLLKSHFGNWLPKYLEKNKNASQPTARKVHVMPSRGE